MSYSLAPSSFSINGSGHLIATYPNGTSNDLGVVVGQAGASGDLFAPTAKSASYTILSTDLNGQSTPVLVASASTGAMTVTIDSALLYSATTTQSLAIVVKRDPADTSTNVLTVAAKTGQTIDGQTSTTLPSKWSYTIIANSTTTLLII